MIGYGDFRTPEGEQWRARRGAQGYEVSNLGRVRCRACGRPRDARRRAERPDLADFPGAGAVLVETAVSG